MGFYYQPAGGAGGNVPTVPSDPVTLDFFTQYQTVQFTNSGDTPASVELSFANGYLKGVDPDQGTPESPSYVIDPDESPRTINLERTATTPDTASSETVTFTGNTGRIGDFTVNLDAAVGIAQAVRDISSATPTWELKFEGNLTSTGSVTDTIPSATLSGVATSIYRGVTGYCEVSASNQFAQKTGVARSTTSAHTDRSWIYVWRNQNNLSQTYLTLGATGDAATGPGWLNRSGSNVFGFLQGLGTLGTGYSNTVQSDSEALLGNADELNLVVCSFDLSALTMTIRWKQTSHSPGHSFRSGARTAQSSTGTHTWTFFGYSAGSSAHTVRHLYRGFVDHIFTADEFDNLWVTLNGWA